MGGLPKEHRAKQKWSRKTHSVAYVPGLSTLPDLSRIEWRARVPPASNAWNTIRCESVERRRNVIPFFGGSSAEIGKWKEEC